jgi:SAM-dependent methyltransferase
MVNPTPSVPAPLALIPYAERFLEGRRAVIFGDATAGLAEEAAERGARLVHLYDPDGARVAQAVATAPQGVSFAVYREGGDAGLRDGAFDVCIIPDLSRFADPQALLALARRLCAAGAVLLAATPRVDGRRGESLRGRPGPLNYYDFHAVIARHFPAVKMVGKVPFQGYALVDFAFDGDLEVSVDASLTDGDDREPVAYVAIASDRRVELDPYAIIQLPGGPPAPAAPAPVALPPAAPAPDPELKKATEARQQAEARLADEQRRSAELSRALSEAGALPRQLEMRLTEEARRAEMLASQIQRAQESSERLLRENRALQERLQQSAKTLAEAQAERARLAQREEALARKLREAEAIPRGVDPAKVEALRKRVEEVEAQHKAALHEVHEGRARLDAALRQTEELKAQLAQQQQQAAALQAQARRASAQAQEEQTEHSAELSKAEAALQERAREIALLRAEVERRGAMVRELLQAIEARDSAGGTSAEQERVAHLERELGAAQAQLRRVSALALQREGEAKAAQTRLDQLGQQLAATAPAAELEAAQREIQALRTALQQERAQRAALEASQGEPTPDEVVLEHQRRPEPGP